MLSTIFNFTDYRELIKEQIKQNQTVRGYQGVLAKAAGCQRSYLSQVLNGHVQLTPDQAARMAEFWKLKDDECAYFVNIVHLARSSSPALKRIIEKRITDLLDRNDDYSRPYNPRVSDNSAAISTYYSSWIYGAIHMATSIKELQTPNAIAERFKLPIDLVVQTLDYLVEQKFVKQHGNEYKILELFIHVPRQAGYANWNHSAWRQRAIEKRSLGEQGGFLSSATQVCTMSRQDALKIKLAISSLMNTMRETFVPSPEEEVYCLTLDWFTV